MTKKAITVKSQPANAESNINEAAKRVIRSRTRDALIENWLGTKIKKYVSKLNRKEGNLYELVMLGIEKPLIKIVLQEVKGNQVSAASILGINRNTLRKKISQYCIKTK